MTVSEYSRFVAKIVILKEVAEEYPRRPLRISSYRWNRERKKLAIVPKKTMK